MDSSPESNTRSGLRAKSPRGTQLLHRFNNDRVYAVAGIGSRRNRFCQRRIHELVKESCCHLGSACIVQALLGLGGLFLFCYVLHWFYIKPWRISGGLTGNTPSTG